MKSCKILMFIIFKYDHNSKTYKLIASLTSLLIFIVKKLFHSIQQSTKMGKLEMYFHILHSQYSRLYNNASLVHLIYFFMSSIFLD